MNTNSSNRSLSNRQVLSFICISCVCVCVCLRARNFKIQKLQNFCASNFTKFQKFQDFRSFSNRQVASRAHFLLAISYSRNPRNSRNFINSRNSRNFRNFRNSRNNSSATTSITSFQLCCAWSRRALCLFVFWIFFSIACRALHALHHLVPRILQRLEAQNLIFQALNSLGQDLAIVFEL